MLCGHILTEDGRFLDTEDGRRLVTECFTPATTTIQPGAVPRRSFILEQMEEDAVIAALLSEL